MRPAPIVLMLLPALGAAAPRGLGAQVEVTPFVGSYVPRRDVGRTYVDGGNGLFAEERVRYGDGVQLGARVGTRLRGWLGAEAMAATSRHTLRRRIRGIDPVSGYSTAWANGGSGPTGRALVVAARATAHAAPWAERPLALHAGLGVVHARWGDNPVDGDAAYGTGLTAGVGFQFRVTPRGAVRLDVEDNRYSMRQPGGFAQHDVGVSVGYAFTLGR